MSRYYRVYVKTKDATQEQLLKTMVEELGWEETDIGEYNDVAYFEGEGNLCGGQSEEQAHNQIIGWLKTITENPKATAVTSWTYLEDLPCTSYGELE